MNWGPLWNWAVGGGNGKIGLVTEVSRLYDTIYIIVCQEKD